MSTIICETLCSKHPTNIITYKTVDEKEQHLRELIGNFEGFGSMDGYICIDDNHEYSFKFSEDAGKLTCLFDILYREYFKTASLIYIEVKDANRKSHKYVIGFKAEQ